jgi:CheY-like chemotaxis protein
MAAMKGRVLVVDDEPTVRSWLAALLAHEGYIVEESEDGATALQALRSFPADVIVLDLIMPGMNGREFLLELREDPRLATTPVVLWTAVKGVNLNLTTLGATEILEKGVDSDEILRKVALAAYRAHGPHHSPTQPPAFQENYEAPSHGDEVVIVVDAVRSRWSRRVGELAASGFTALPRIEPPAKIMRLARALDAVAVLVEKSALAAEPSWAEQLARSMDITATSPATSPAVREFDATALAIDEDLQLFLQGCAMKRRAARRG